MKEFDIDIIIAKSISGNIEQSEMIIFEEWLHSSGKNREIYQQARKVWESCEIPLSGNELEKDLSKVIYGISVLQSRKISNQKRRWFFYKAAAVFVLPVVFAIGLYHYNKNEKDGDASIQQCEIVAPKGHLSKCILPDGTIIWINTGSTITYNAASFSNKFREVRLTGEAFFKVAKDKDKPFIVITDYSDIKVTGTSFNVKAYPDAYIFETVLEEGEVEVILHYNMEQKIKLETSERLVFEMSDRSVSVGKVDAKLYTSWRNGEILFKDATLNDLISELERIYDIRFELRDKNLGNFRFRGMFSYNNNLIDALGKIKETSGIDYYIKNNTVYLSSKKLSK